MTGPARWIICGIVLCGCQAMPKVPPTTPTGETTIKAADFTAQVPADWKAVTEGGDFVFAAVPNGVSGNENDPTVAIQVPQLPPHIPGFLPLGGVAGGYLQDLEKRYPDQTVDERSAVKLDDADARRFVSSFQNHGKPWRELALLAVHGDHVYVITGNCDASAFDQTKKAFDALVASVKWTAKS